MSAWVHRHRCPCPGPSARGGRRAVRHVRHPVEGQPDGPDRDPGAAAVPVVPKLFGQLRAGQAPGEQPDVVEDPATSSGAADLARDVDGDGGLPVGIRSRSGWSPARRPDRLAAAAAPRPDRWSGRSGRGGRSCPARAAVGVGVGLLATAARMLRYPCTGTGLRTAPRAGPRSPRVWCEQVVGAHQEARRAETALERVVLPNDSCSGCRSSWPAEALDGGDLRTVELDREQQAGPGRLAVDEHGAHPAHAVLAPDVRAGQAEVVPQRVGNVTRAGRLTRRPRAVHGHPDVDGFAGLGAGFGVLGSITRIPLSGGSGTRLVCPADLAGDQAGDQLAAVVARACASPSVSTTSSAIAVSVVGQRPRRSARRGPPGSLSAARAAAETCGDRLVGDAEPGHPRRSPRRRPAPGRRRRRARNRRAVRAISANPKPSPSRRPGSAPRSRVLGPEHGGHRAGEELPRRHPAAPPVPVTVSWRSGSTPRRAARRPGRRGRGSRRRCPGCAVPGARPRAAPCPAREPGATGSRSTRR